MNCEAMNSVGFTADERSTIWKIISAILHLVILVIAFLCYMVIFFNSSLQVKKNSD